MNSDPAPLRLIARPRFEARPKIDAAAGPFEMRGGLVVFVGGDVDGHRGFFEFFRQVVAAPVFRIDLLDLVEVGGETDAALLEVLGLLAHLKQSAVDEGERGGEFLGEFDLLGKEGALAAGEFLQLAFLAFQLLALELDAVEFLLRVLELAVVVFVAIRAATGRTFPFASSGS